MQQSNGATIRVSEALLARPKAFAAAAPLAGGRRQALLLVLHSLAFTCIHSYHSIN